MTLLSVVLIAKTGVPQASNIKEYREEELYRRASFKSAVDFTRQTVYRIHDKDIYVYGKTTGRAGQENKYEFPPPIAEKLFFGTVLLLAKQKDTDIPVSLAAEEWEQACETLMGGFEDLGSDDSTSEEEEGCCSRELVEEEYVA